MGDGHVATIWGLIDAELVTFPVVAEELNAAIVTFTTDRDAAESCVPNDLFEVADDGGRVEVVLALFEYLRGDWAPCNSLDIAVPVRPVAGLGPDRRRGLFMCPTLVSHPFNSEAAYWAMGVERAVGDIGVVVDPDDPGAPGGTVVFRAQDGGRRPTTVTLPRGLHPDRSLLWTTRAYTCIAGRPYVVPFEMGLPCEPLDPAAVRIDLGTGPLADTLATLGLPSAPVTFAGWAEALTGLYHQGTGLTPTGLRAAPPPPAGTEDASLRTT